jgi:hypothetical protein
LNYCRAPYREASNSQRRLEPAEKKSCDNVSRIEHTGHIFGMLVNCVPRRIPELKRYRTVLLLQPVLYDCSGQRNRPRFWTQICTDTGKTWMLVPILHVLRAHHCDQSTPHRVKAGWLWLGKLPFSLRETISFPSRASSWRIVCSHHRACMYACMLVLQEYHAHFLLHNFSRIRKGYR